MKRFTVVFALAVVTTACHGGSSPVATPRSVITGFSVAQLDRSFAVVNSAAWQDPRGLRTAASALLDSTDPVEQYAAAYAQSISADPGSVAQLTDLLNSTVETERLLAAAALVRLGDPAGIPILIDALGSDGPLVYWDPPESAWAFAQPILLRATGEDLGLRKARTAVQAAAAQTAWKRWWNAHGDTFALPTPTASPVP